MDENKKTAATAGGAIGLSALGSIVGLCCIGPWAVALFGVTGAVTVARWQPLRPYILSVAALMLVWAFWKVYRRPTVCQDGSCAKGPSVWLKATLWLAGLLLVGAFFAEYLQALVDPTPGGTYS